MSALGEPVDYRINGLRTALREGGTPQGTPLLLLHGFADNSAGFMPMAQAIEAIAPNRFRFLAPDWRGHGQSAHLGGSYWFPDYLADLEALLDQVVGRDTRVVLAGHSMGGQIASQYAGLRPARVSHLITLDSLNVPDADSAKAPSRYRRWLDAVAAPPTHRSAPDVDAIAERIGKRYPELDDGMRHFLAWHWATPAPDGGQQLHFDPWHRVTFPYGFRLADAMAMWREVTAKVLCVDAGDSPARHYVDADDMARRRACFAHLEHVVIDGCGHMLHVQRPERLARIITEFLALP